MLFIIRIRRRRFNSRPADAVDDPADSFSVERRMATGRVRSGAQVRRHHRIDMAAQQIAREAGEHVHCVGLRRHAVRDQRRAIPTAAPAVRRCRFGSAILASSHAGAAANVAALSTDQA